MRTLFAIALFSVTSVFAATPVVTTENPVRTGDIVNYVEEIETPVEFYDSLADTMASTEGAWNDPLDPGDFLDPIPDDFDLPLPIPGPIGGGNETLVIIDQIINIGERIWKFIADNKPVIDVKRNYANALPKGVRTSEELDGFSPLQYRSFRMYGKNGFKKTVYDVTFTLIHRYNGNYRGEGSYIENATVLPHKVEALWGYKVEASVDNVGAVNVGTKEKPVGSLIMEMTFKVNTVIKAMDYRSVYEFRGDRRDVTTIHSDRGSDNAGDGDSEIQHFVE